jgi:uncharacterized protein with NAD-binding domain and iron-sulfur cluster
MATASAKPGTSIASHSGNDRRRRVAILGAGPAGLAAAFALSDTPELRERFEVTIYQMGWRPGGKCASGRDVGTAEKPGSFRVEQNGAHYLFGCYQQSFALVRKCFARLTNTGAYGCLSEDFVPGHRLVWMQATPTGGWEQNRMFLPANLSKPGEGGEWCEPFDYCLMGWQLLLQVGVDWLDTPTRFRSAELVHRLFPFQPFGENLWGRLVRVSLQPLRLIVNVGTRAVMRGLRAMSRASPAPLRDGVRGRLAALAESIAARAASRCRRVRSQGSGAAAQADKVTPLLVVLEVAATTMRGILIDRVDVHGFDQVDAEDFRAWLRRHGASQQSVDCGLVKMWYDAVIAYEDGDPERPGCAAGVAINAILHAILGYKGAFAFHMRAEIGDSFIAPIVAALERQGVRMAYFQRVRELIPVVGVDGRARIDRIEIEPQAPGQSSAAMVALPGSSRRVWPNRPLDAELAASVPPLDSFYAADSGRRVSLEAGRDFDDVVLSLPLGTLPSVCARLIAEQERWRDMSTRLGSAESISLRLWFNRTMSELGWETPPAVLSGFAAPFSTWEDGRQTLATETGTWPESVRSAASLFGPWPRPLGLCATDPEAPAYWTEQSRAGRIAVEDFFQEHFGVLWPRGRDSGGVPDYGILVAAPAVAGVARLHAQYCSVNVGPCERYVLALPGTLEYRLAPDQSGYANLVLAGEWTRNGIEIGCIEGAVRSGLRAAQLLSDAGSEGSAGGPR